MQAEAHWVRKPFAVGDEVAALCGHEFTVSTATPTGIPICSSCAEAMALLSRPTTHSVATWTVAIVRPARTGAGDPFPLAA